MMLCGLLALDEEGFWGTAGISIGIPKKITLKNINTSDYFIADSGGVANSTSRANEVGEGIVANPNNDNADIKIFGLKWNKPIIAGLTGADSRFKSSPVSWCG